MPSVRVKENEYFDAALRRFKRACEKAKRRRSNGTQSACLAMKPSASVSTNTPVRRVRGARY
jgi:hypothetical protein